MYAIKHVVGFRLSMEQTVLMLWWGDRHHFYSRNRRFF